MYLVDAAGSWMDHSLDYSKLLLLPSDGQQSRLQSSLYFWKFHITYLRPTKSVVDDTCIFD